MTHDVLVGKLRQVLTEEVEHLLDFKLQLMEREIAEGWRAFYARELYFKQHLPPPLINDLGRLYETESLREEIERAPGQGESGYSSTFLKQLYSDTELQDRYRNFLWTGWLFGDGVPEIYPLDRTANAVVMRLMETGHEHWSFKCRADLQDWYVEATARATLTPPLLVWPKEDETPARTTSLPLLLDGNYWRAVYPSKYRIATDPAAYEATTKPHWNLQLMSNLAPDFPYDARISSARRLVFVQQGDSPLAWALMIEKPSGAPDFRYPPKLLLIDRQQKKKLSDGDIIFENVINHWFYSSLKSPRHMETELLFHLPRSRRLIDFYQPFVDEAMRRAG